MRSVLAPLSNAGLPVTLRLARIPNRAAPAGASTDNTALRRFRTEHAQLDVPRTAHLAHLQPIRLKSRFSWLRTACVKKPSPDSHPRFSGQWSTPEENEVRSEVCRSTAPAHGAFCASEPVRQENDMIKKIVVITAGFATVAALGAVDANAQWWWNRFRGNVNVQGDYVQADVEVLTRGPVHEAFA